MGKQYLTIDGEETHVFDNTKSIVYDNPRDVKIMSNFNSMTNSPYAKSQMAFKNKNIMHINEGSVDSLASQ